LEGETLEEFIDWRLTDPTIKINPHLHKEHPAMSQQQWTIEVRADFSDPGKVELIDEIMRAAALQVHANLDFLKEQQKPQVVCYSDNFFHTRRDIDLMAAKGDNPLQKAIDAYAAQMTAVEISDELLEAAQEQESNNDR
jgi:hypothetical protein